MPVHIKEKIRYGLNVISKRRWWIIAPYCFSMLIGLSMSMLFPKVYEATTLISVESQKVSGNFIQSHVSSNSDHRINSIPQQIMSRRNLERVIDRVNLFADPKYGSMLIEDKLTGLRKKIKVEILHDRPEKGTEAIAITYQDEDPASATQVANELATVFIEESQLFREERAVGASDFLEAELGATRKRMEEQEQKLNNFSAGNMGEQSGQLDSNLISLNRLKLKLSQQIDSLKHEKELDSQSTEQGGVRAVAKLAAAAPMAPDFSKESLKHEKELDSQTTEQGNFSDRASMAASMAPYLSTDAECRSNELNESIHSLESEIARINKEIKEYQSRVEATFKSEQDLLSLKRDYDNIKALYNSLLARKLEADIANNFEKKQKGNQFHIIDLARLQENSIGYDRKAIFILCSVLGSVFCFLAILVTGKHKNPKSSEEEYNEVGFSAFYPREVNACTRYSLIFYAHLKDVIAAIEKDARKFTDELGGDIDRPKRSKESAMIKEGTPITVAAVCDQLDFSPGQMSKKWEAPFIRFIFDFKPKHDLVNEPLVVRFSVRVYEVEIACLKFAIEVTDKSKNRLSAKQMALSSGGIHNQIFMSYSMKDREAVNAYRRVYESVSKNIFVDSYSIDLWGERAEVLPKLIEGSDVFHLFWSKNAAKSPRVKEEFETALNMRCLGNFSTQPCRSFFQLFHWNEPLSPELWKELKDFKSNFLHEVKNIDPFMEAGTVKNLFIYVSSSFGNVSGIFQKAFDYVKTDPSGSLNKSRVLLEALLLNSYRSEMGKESKEKQIGVILCDNQFTRKIDRGTLHRMKTVRDFGNMGSHYGEPVEIKDAIRCFRDLLDIINWHKGRYGSALSGTLSQPDRNGVAGRGAVIPQILNHHSNQGQAVDIGCIHSGQSLTSRNPSPPSSLVDSGY